MKMKLSQNKREKRLIREHFNRVSKILNLGYYLRNAKEDEDALFEIVAMHKWGGKKQISSPVFAIYTNEEETKFNLVWFKDCPGSRIEPPSVEDVEILKDESVGNCVNKIIHCIVDDIINNIGETIQMAELDRLDRLVNIKDFI